MQWQKRNSLECDRAANQGQSGTNNGISSKEEGAVINVEKPHKEGTVTIVNIHYDDDGVPGMRGPVASISTTVSTGTITFSSVKLTYPYEQTNWRGFSFNAGKYFVCFGKSHDHEEELELITDCKSLIVKDHKKEMIKKARMWAPAVLKDDERLGFKVKFRTGITRKINGLAYFKQNAMVDHLKMVTVYIRSTLLVTLTSNEMCRSIVSLISDGGS